MIEKPKIWFVRVILIVAAAGVIYFVVQKTKVPSSANVIAQGHTSEFRSTKDFPWFNG